MNIYLISQYENENYDTFDSAIVAAETEEKARNILPSREGWTPCDGTWCSSPEVVIVKYLGVAAEGIEAGCILGSFNAG